MNTNIIATEISLNDSDYLIQEVRVNVFLNESNTVYQDWLAIKRALESKLGMGVKNFTYRYE